MERRVASVDGGVVNPSDDSAVFYTFPCEQEPNDAEDMADTISSVMCGRVSDVSDIDIFLCPRKNIGAVYLRSVDCSDSFFIRDGLSCLYYVNGPAKQADTIFLPDSVEAPMFIFVRSGIKGFEGNYKLGLIGR